MIKLPISGSTSVNQSTAFSKYFITPMGRVYSQTIRGFDGDNLITEIFVGEL